MRSTFWMYVPSGLPGLSPSFWNCCVRYATALSSPGVPGARPSIESAERSLMCCSNEALSIACAAAVAAAALAVVSVNGVEELAAVVAPDVAPDLLSVAHPAAATAASSTQNRRERSTAGPRLTLMAVMLAKSPEGRGERQVAEL